MGYTFKKVNQIAGGAQQSDNTCLSDEAFFETYIEKKKKEKPKRLTNQELKNLYNSKHKLTKEQKLLKSVLDDCIATDISNEAFSNVNDMYTFRRKYKHYLRIKRFIPLSLVAPCTNVELSKMAYAAALGSKSVSLTLPGLIGYSLPAFFFFHMTSYYAPDKIKPVCNLCKYTLGAPFWIVNSLTDEVLSYPEEAFFGESVPIDITGTGGTIPGEIGDFNKLREVLKDMNEWSKKSYQ